MSTARAYDRPPSPDTAALVGSGAPWERHRLEVSLDEVKAIAQLARLAAERSGAASRAEQALGAVIEIAPSEGAVLASWDPVARRHRVVAHFGIPRELLDYCSSVAMSSSPGYRLVRARRVPHRRCDVPGALESRMTKQVFIPAGFHEGVTACLFHEDRYTGILNLASRDARPQREDTMMLLLAAQESLGRLLDLTQTLDAAVAVLRPGALAVVIEPGGGVTGVAEPADELARERMRALLTERAVVAARRRAPRSPGAQSFLWHADGRLWRFLAVRLAPEAHAPGTILLGVEPAEVPLSVRELQVLAEMSEGRSNTAIGRALGISSRTVGHHVEHILAKLGVSGRVQASVSAVREGFVLAQESLASTAPAAVE